MFKKIFTAFIAVTLLCLPVYANDDYFYDLQENNLIAAVAKVNLYKTLSGQITAAPHNSNYTNLETTVNGLVDLIDGTEDFTKIDVDNLTLNGNTISSTAGKIILAPLSGQDLELTPGGVGNVNITANDLEFAGTVRITSAGNASFVDIDAGASGVVGTIDVFPATAGNGKLIISCSDQGGERNITLNADANTQATTVHIPDVNLADSYVVLSTAPLTAAEVDVLDAVTKGTVSANKAVVVGATSKVDVWNVDNLVINGNDISSTSGGVTITPLSGQNFTLTTAGAGSILLTRANGTTTFNSTGGITLDASSYAGTQHFDLKPKAGQISDIRLFDGASTEKFHISKTAANALNIANEAEDAYIQLTSAGAWSHVAKVNTNINYTTSGTGIATFTNASGYSPSFTDGVATRYAIKHYAEMAGTNTGAQTLTTAGTYYKITLFDEDGEEFGANANHTNDRITIARTGVYKITVTGSFATDGDNRQMTFVLRKAGTTQIGKGTTVIHTDTANLRTPISISTIATMTAADYIELYVSAGVNSTNIALNDVVISVEEI